MTNSLVSVIRAYMQEHDDAARSDDFVSVPCACLLCDNARKALDQTSAAVHLGTLQDAARSRLRATHGDDCQCDECKRSRRQP